ncbi:MAG: hypothetical protein WCO06_03595 [Candidatus Roizmanbacteria bacterium]
MKNKLVLVFLLLFFGLQFFSYPVFATSSTYNPSLENKILQAGFFANRITIKGKSGKEIQALRASQTNYKDQTWSRDLEYATRGYSHVLSTEDMTILRDNIQLFLDTEGASCLIYPFPQNSLKQIRGVVAETIHENSKWENAYGTNCENRRSWDSMPNVIQATYAYVSRTGDIEFVNLNKSKLLNIANWIKNLDTDGDELPDEKNIPEDKRFIWGYYDSTTNSVMHTYALAKFYASYLAIAELTGDNSWSSRATKLKENFMKDISAGGYWKEGQPWPIAWKKPDGSYVNTPETFGMFEAISSGLIGKQDGSKYTNMMKYLNENVGTMTSDNSPLKLAIGGYKDQPKRDELTPLWMLNASAPWITGLAIPSFLDAGYTQSAKSILDKYSTMASNISPPVLEFTSNGGDGFPSGESSDQGRTWDNASWFMSVYGGHYGFRPHPYSIEFKPAPLKNVQGDKVIGYDYQSTKINLILDSQNGIYYVETDKLINLVTFLPMSNNLLISVNSSQPSTSVPQKIDGCIVYSIVSGNNQNEINDRNSKVNPPKSSFCPFATQQKYNFVSNANINQPNTNNNVASSENMSTTSTIHAFSDTIPTNPSGPAKSDIKSFGDISQLPLGVCPTEDTSLNGDNLSDGRQYPDCPYDQYGNLRSVACVANLENQRSRDVFYAYVTTILQKTYPCSK